METGAPGFRTAMGLHPALGAARIIFKLTTDFVETVAHRDMNVFVRVLGIGALFLPRLLDAGGSVASVAAAARQAIDAGAA